jgi:hypothetical protein
MKRSYRKNLARVACCSALGALLGAFATANAADLFHAPWRAYDAGVFPNIGPAQVEAGDLDGDGDDDLLLALWYFGGPGIGVLKAQPDGSFGEFRAYGTGHSRSVADVALSDVDGDGDLDALATVPEPGFANRLVALWRNDGNGNFGNLRAFQTGEGPTGIVVADFTGDGFEDVVTADMGFPGFGTTVSLLVHNGQSGPGAGFLAPRSFEVGKFPEVVRAGDFDGDGDLDLAVGRDTGTTADAGVAVLMNEDGAGSFGPPALYDLGGTDSIGTSALAVDDLDRDGDLDLIGSGSGSVGYRLGNGDGTFGPLVRLPMVDWAFTVHALETGDLNGDGFPDIVAATPTGRALDGFHVFLSNGTGGFAPDVFHEAAKQTYDLTLIDVDNDGDRDVITVANDSAVVTVHRNPGDGGFYVPRRFPSGVLTSGMDGADIDGDGDIDIATAGDKVRVLRNRGDATFEPQFSVPTPGVNPATIKLRDMNGDGAPDILVSDDLNADFSVALNRGDGTFETGVETRLGGTQGGEVDAFDLNNDGINDVVVTDPGPVPRIHLARGLGNGTSFAVQPPLDFGALPFGIDGGDFDHDGNIDLVSSTAFGLTVFPGRGDFTFDPMLPTGVQTLDFTVTDLNQDGHPDIVYDAGQRTTSTEWVGVILGYGDGAFQFPKEYPGPVGLESAFSITADIDAGDVNGDGLPDVVLSGYAPNDLSVFIANPDGTLRPHERYGVDYQPAHSVIADFNGDGAADVATSISLPPSGIDDAVVVLEAIAPGVPLALDISGACPGRLTIAARGATPNGRVHFLRATGSGNAVWPAGPCAGTQLGLDGSVKRLRTLTADANGIVSFTINAPPGVCGVCLVQAIDIGTCSTTDVGAL